MFTIKAKKRDISANLEMLRKAGEMPSVFYGMGKESTPVSVSIIDFKKIWRDAGESSTVTVSTPEGDLNTLIHDVQVNPITDEPIHADFLVIDVNKAIQVNVPIEFEGVSSAVKGGLGTLVKVLHEVEIEALPKDLPHNLVVDISKLETVDDQILVSDIVLPKGVIMVTPAEEVVASIALQKEEVEDSTPIDLSAIEVEKKGKKEEETPASE
jgi:large subunit ribosomal protein L25